MSRATGNKKKFRIKKSQEIEFKKPSLFRKVVSFITAYSMMFLNITPVFATNITGVAGANGVYNIEAAKISGDTGFRQYTDFTLDDGDVANLQFQKGTQEYDKFVNMVDNQVNINGIVNTVKGDAFYGGHAIFVSPSGIVVGASGVLNVGALTMAAPNSDKYNDLKEAFNDDDLSDYIHGAEKYDELLSSSEGNITVNGKIMAKDNVELYGKNITIEGKNGNRAGIVAGVKNQNKITTPQQAQEIFDALVSNNIKNADTFDLEGGKIKIKASGNKTVDSVKSAKADIKKADLGANEVNIRAEAESDDKIDMVKTEINIENTDITADKIDIKAESKRNHTVVLGNNDYIDGVNSTAIELLTNLIGGSDSHFPFGATGASEAKVTVKDSVLQSLKQDIILKADASFSTKDNLNLMYPALLMMLIDLFGDDASDPEVERADASFTQFFSGNIYEGFDGPRTRAEVTVDNTDITALKGNIEISAEASSELNLSTGIEGLIIPVAIYGFGTSTVARAIVKNLSKLNIEEGDVNVDAFSNNTNNIRLLNSGITSLTIEDFFVLTIINNTVKTTTEAKVEDSTVTTSDLEVRAVNTTDSDIDIDIETTAGEADQDPEQNPDNPVQGNSAVSGIGILHRSHNDISAVIKNSTVTSENTSVLAQSLNATSNSGSADVDDREVEKPAPFWNNSITQWERQVQGKLKAAQRKYINKSLFNRIKGGGNFVGQQGATLEAGGVFVWSKTDNNATAKIEDSTITTAKDVSVQANTIDIMDNAATSDTAGEEKVSLSITAVINDEKNTTNAQVDGSTVKAKNLTVNATTELPVNDGELIFGLKFPFKIKGVDGLYFGGTFGHGADGKWDVDFKYPKIDGDKPLFEMGELTNKTAYANYEDIKPKLRWDGFFTNFAQTNGIGSKVAIDGSFIYNEVVNNTTANITGNSAIVLNAVEKNGEYEGGNLIVNAVNSVIGWNALGMIDFLIKQVNYRIPGQINWEYEPQDEAGTFGLGVNFLWDIYTNNAIAKIENSTVDTQNGSVSVNAATEQEYVTAEVTGGKSEFIGIDGSANVQKIYGDTIAQIVGSENIKAAEVEVNAGKGTIRTAADGAETDEETGTAKLNDERAVKDAMTIINFLPTWSGQSAEQDQGQQTVSAGVAVGSGVNVSNIERNINAEINNSTVITAKDIDIKADTYSQTLNVIAAAAWSGGVTPAQPGGQGGGQQGGDDNQPAVQNDIGNVQQNLDNAQDDEDGDLFGNLFDGEEEFMQAPVGNALTALRNKFSLSVAGAVLILNDKTNVTAAVNNSDITVGEDLNVSADRETRMITISGGISKSGKIGAGAAVNVYMSDGSVKADVKDSTITFNSPANAQENPQLNVKANNTNKIINIAIGVGLAPNADVSDESLKMAIGGSYSKNTLKPEIEAFIENSTIKTKENGKKIDTEVKAENHVVIYNIAGGGAYLNGGSTSLGAGAAVNYNNIEHTILAYIHNSTLKNLNKLSVVADTDNDLTGFAVAGSLAFGFNTTGIAFDGSGDVDYIHDTLAAKILGSTIEADDDVIVNAASKSDNLAVAGSLDISLTSGGGGVNGGLVVNVYRNKITAQIDDSFKMVQNENGEMEAVLDRSSQILKAKDVMVSATSTEKSNVIPIGLAVGTGGQFLMAAANVGVNVIDNTIEAYISGKVGAGQGAEAVHDAVASAYDETTLYSRGGTVGVSLGESALAVFAGSVNVDKINKTVEAKIVNADIKATGGVSATASAVNSLGGTKNENNEYSRDDVTSEEYREKLLHKNETTGEYDGLKLKKKEDSDDDDNQYIALEQDSDFKNWNMFYDVAVSRYLAISGTGIGKVISNKITAEISNSKIESDKLDIIADDYSIKNIIAGTIGASGAGSVGLQVIYTRDESTTKALVTKGSELNVANAIKIDASNRKDNHQILVVGSGAKYFTVDGNFIINKVIDEVYANIDNASTTKEIKAETISLSADENISASNIAVTGSGSKSFSLNVSPFINTYGSTTEATIKNALIKNAGIDMDAESKINTLNVSAGFSGAYQGFSGVGIAIKNDFTNKVRAYIDNAKINTTRNVFIDANSIIDATNWLVGVALVYQGLDIPVNVLLNNVTSEVEAGIKNSDIEKSGAITINANKDKKDKITNRAIAAGGVFQGATLGANVIKNVYKNTVTSYVDNTSSAIIDALSVNAYSDRKTENINVGVGFAGEGASLLANAVDNEIGSTTRAYVDVKSKTLNITNALSLDTKDQMVADNAMAMVNAGLYGAGVGANIDLYYTDNLVKSEIATETTGQINAGSTLLKSEITDALRTQPFDLTFGLGALPVDVQIVKIGKQTVTYSAVEQPFVDKAGKLVPDILYTPITDSGNLVTGAVSGVKGNLKTSGNTQINAETKLKGIDGDGNLIDKLKINNTNVTVAGVEVNVGVRRLDIAANTVAEIIGGKVESTQGDIELKAESKSDVEIDSSAVDVGLAQVSGRSVKYNNSSETVSRVKNATVNAKDIDIISKSDNKTLIDASSVIVALGGVVTVDLVEATDTNKSVALITGNTNINATGKLSLHSTATSDMSAIKSSVPVQIVDVVSVSRNRADVSSISRAIIENVNGTISTNGLDIITDYDKMLAYSQSNIVAVKPIDIASYNDSGAYMNATFKSGIDSTELTLINSGDTNIVTARDNQSDGDGMVAKGNISNVHVSLANFYTGAFSKAENTATSSTILNVKEHTSQNLNIDQYLHSTATADAGNDRITLVGFASAAAADAKDTSTLNLNISGTNTVLQNAVINATHNSKIKSDLSAFNLGVIVSGGRIRIDSELTSDTNANIGGKFNVGSASVNINTHRDSTMSKGSGSGGFINVSDTEAHNTLRGDSILNLKNLTSDAAKTDSWDISNKSENIFDVETTDGSGGFINVSLSDLFLNFETSTDIKVENSNINAKGKVKIGVDNKEILRESAWNNGGGFISVINNYTLNEYTAGAQLLIKDSQIKAKDIDLKASSDMRTHDNDFIKYSGAGGGAVAVSYFTLINKLTQTSEIKLQNSVLNAARNAEIQAVTSSLFKQKIDGDLRGLVSAPRFENTLEVTNTNKLELDNKSKITAGEKLDISFNSNNDLAVRTFSDARNFEGVPSALSYLYLTINNVVENSGSLQAGNLVDIDYMNKSVNNLDQYAHTENDAFIASTTEGGILSRKVNNTLNVNSGADITSGQDIDIGYSVGIMKPTSEVSWVTKSLWFITDSGSSTVDKPSNNYSLKNDGEIVAGQGNSRYMRINRDGTVDMSTLKGFYDGDYILYDGQLIDGQEAKDNNLAAITADIRSIDEALTELNGTISDLEATINYFDAQKTPLLTKLSEINELQADGYILTEAKTDADGNSDFNTIIQNDLYDLLIDETDANKVTQEQYNQFINAYGSKLEEINAYNYGYTEKLEIPTIAEFIDANDYGLSDAQKANIALNYGTADALLVGENENQISLEQYNQITVAYKEKINDINIHNYGHSEKKETPTFWEFLEGYDFTEAQITTIKDGYSTINSRLQSTTVGKFTTYENSSGKYVSVTDLDVTGDEPTFKELTQIKSELSLLNNQIGAYTARKNSNVAAQTALNTKKNSLQAEYDNLLATDALKYERVDNLYLIVFNDIDYKNARINIDGAYNGNISGHGEFRVASGGVKIDNYSPRSVIFGEINVDSATGNGLFIGGKNHAEFADKEQAVSGKDAYEYINNISGHKAFNELPTDGAHYVSGDDGTVGVTVNNYYDVLHPFADTFDIPNPTMEANVFFVDDINTSILNVWSESGNILVLSDNLDIGTLNAYSTNGLIGIVMGSGSEFALNSGSNMFASDGVFINADSVNIAGNIKTGYTERSITITDEMLNNLITDPTSGEVNMINLGGTVSPYLNDVNNIKAIYKDGAIYLYNLPETVTNNGVRISKIISENSTGTITGNITTADGYQNITIVNETDKPLNVENITNAYFEGVVETNGIDTESATITKNSKNHAETNITSAGKLILDGIIRNNVRRSLVDDSYLVQTANGKLNVEANNGLDIAQILQIGNIVDTIFAGGLIDITINGGKADIAGNITDKGNIAIYSYGDDDIDINGDITDTIGNINIQNDGTGKLTLNGKILARKGDISVLGTGTGVTVITDEITDNQGDITIVSKGLTASEDATVRAKNGDISITNNADTLALYGSINADSGNLSLQNNGDTAIIAGYITDEQGDLTIINNKGNMTISAEIYHNYVNSEAEGMITVVNNPGGELLNIQSAIQTWGKGKTEDDKTTAILLDNRSGNTGMTIDKAVTARIGDIIIRNTAKDLTISGAISNTEQGNIEIYNTGKDLQTTSNITNTKGDTTIANTGTGKTLVDGSILNKDGNTAISGSGTMLELSGTVNNTGGNTSLTNTAGQLQITGNITNKGGDITANNTGSLTEITSVIKNEDGSIHLSNSGGDFNIDDNAQISNNTANAEDSITIANSGDNLNISGIVESTNKGNIVITNAGSVANLKNRIFAQEGDINISNSNAGALKLMGDVVDYKGNVSITNTGTNGAEIGGIITDEKGDITITNNGGDILTYTGSIINYDGAVVINNKENAKQAQIGGTITNKKGNTTLSNAGLNMTFSGSIDNQDGSVNILGTNSGNNAFVKVGGNVSNQGGDVVINNLGSYTEVSAEITNKNGAIAISNAKGNLVITENAAIENDTANAAQGITLGNADTANILRMNGAIDSLNKGNISIVNNGSGNTIITGDITAHNGNIGITNNTAGNLNIEDATVVTETAGNINIYGSGGKLSVIDAWLETDTEGDITITNEGSDATSVSGDVITDKGDILISNKAEKLEISADISANQGDIDIENHGADLEIAEDASIATETEGGISVINEGNGNLSIDGDITAETVGDILINNSGKKLSVSSDITAKEGKIDIINEGTDAALIEGDITATTGDITVVNNTKTLDISGDISTAKGDVDITNNSTDSGTTISGDVSTDNGEVSIENNGGKLTVSGDITDTEGNIEIANHGADGSDISQKVSAEEGNITVNNTAGTLSLTATGDITADKGNIAVENAGDKLAVFGQISNNNGKVDITNNGDNGAEFASSAKVTNNQANTVITNNKGDLIIADGAEIKNIESGNIRIENKDDVFSVAGKIAHSGTGDIGLNNSGAESFELTSTGEVAADKGNISIINTAAKGAKIAGTIIDKDGNTAIDNKNSLTYAATLKNSGGDTIIANTGDAAMSGSVSNTGGNTSIANSGGALSLASTVNNVGGNLSITNSGNGTTVSGDLDNTGGDVVIENIGKDLVLTADSTVDNNDTGNISITNSGDGKLALNGAINNNVSGNTIITNTGANGAEIAGKITNTQGNLTVQNQKSDLVFTQGSALQNRTSGDIKIENTAEAATLTVAGVLDNSGNGNIVTENRGAGEFTITPSGNIYAANGDINLTNINNGGMQIAGQVVANNGKTTVDNTSKDGMKVATTGQIIGKTGDIAINNSGANGIKIEGKVLAQKQNIIINNRDSDLIIGELDSANDNYVEATAGDIVIKQANGDILNGIIDTSGNKHQNADLGNPQQSYKTLISAAGDLVMKVSDGDIGHTDNTSPGFSIDASTRDWTDSVNINVGGDVMAIAANDNKSDARLINLRAKDSDMNVKNVMADGNVLLTAADWKQADVSPTPDDEEYFKGYSVINTADGDEAAVSGRNISVIASNNIGSKDKNFKYMQDTAADPDSSVSFEAEYDLKITGTANSDSETKIYQIISKHGTLDLNLESDAAIGYITSGDGLEITQKAQNLTIGEIGLSSSEYIPQDDFEDILYPHDGLIYGDDSPSGGNVVPKYVMISVLDAIDTAERSDSNLKIYSLTVRGNNGDNADYYPDGGRLADVTLMADNIYVNSDKAPDSNVSTKANPDGYKQTQTSYNDEIFGGKGEIHNAKGINAYGEGTPLSLDIIGVDKDIVENIVTNPQRNEYKEQTSLKDIPSKFKNVEDSIYDYDFRVKNAVISVNDYVDSERGVEFDTLYADNAYVNTMDTNLTIHDGYVNNYAELRNGNRDADSSRYLVVIDNDYRRLVPSNVQLYTTKTGSFGLSINDKVRMHTPSPVTHYDWDKLVNTFDDENSFVRLGMKETEIRQQAKQYYQYGNIYVMPENIEARYEVQKEGALAANVEIIEISRYDAVIVNQYSWQLGEEHELELRFDDVNAKLKCVVTKIENNLATVKFKDMPAGIANRLAHRYMKTAGK